MLILAGDDAKVWNETLAVMARCGADGREEIAGGTVARVCGIAALAGGQR